MESEKNMQTKKTEDKKKKNKEAGIMLPTAI